MRSSYSCSRRPLLLIPALVLTAGCNTVRVTDPQHTATELFLMTQAIQEATAQLGAQPLRDRKVFVDAANLAAPQKEFIIAELRAHLLLAGLRMQEKREEAEVIVEVRSGGVGVDRYESMVGIPSLLIPAGASLGDGAGFSGDAGTLITPELALVKNIKQKGYASVAFIAFWRDTGELVAASGPFIGRTERSDWWFFGFGPNISGDIPTVEPDED
ncbi:MAG: DUF6655 family protein [Phycisphaeraceae bacterium]